MLDSWWVQDDIAGFLDVGGDIVVGIFWATFLMCEAYYRALSVFRFSAP